MGIFSLFPCSPFQRVMKGLAIISISLSPKIRQLFSEISFTRAALPLALYFSLRTLRSKPCFMLVCAAQPTKLLL